MVVAPGSVVAPDSAAAWGSLGEAWPPLFAAAPETNGAMGKIKADKAKVKAVVEKVLIGVGVALGAVVFFGLLYAVITWSRTAKMRREAAVANAEADVLAAEMGLPAGGGVGRLAGGRRLYSALGRGMVPL